MLLRFAERRMWKAPPSQYNLALLVPLDESHIFCIEPKRVRPGLRAKPCQTFY